LLTDTFFRRYEDVTLWSAFAERDRRFLGQAAQLIADDMYVRNKVRFAESRHDPAMKGQEVVHSKLARELGRAYLVAPTFTNSWKAPNGNTVSQNYSRTADNKTKLYLTDQFKDSYCPDLFMKYRISFIELAFQERANQLALQKASLNLCLGKSWYDKEKSANDAGEVEFVAQVLELNERFRQAKIPLSYHNNLIQMSEDALIDQEVERPFWSLVSDPKWAVVDQQMKESLDERDRGDRNAVSNALNALESTIKTISNDKGWTTGNERGAANYIDNLVKERTGTRFIQVWEKDVLVTLFSDIRNHFGHGPASGQPLPSLLPQQTAWAIDSCMIWIKSLIRRA
jgi:AbiJ N-terminal domain 4